MRPGQPRPGAGAGRTARMRTAAGTPAATQHPPGWDPAGGRPPPELAAKCPSRMLDCACVAIKISHVSKAGMLLTCRIRLCIAFWYLVPGKGKLEKETLHACREERRAEAGGAKRKHSPVRWEPKQDGGSEAEPRRGAKRSKGDRERGGHKERRERSREERPSRDRCEVPVLSVEQCRCTQACMRTALVLSTRRCMIVSCRCSLAIGDLWYYPL